MKIQTKFNVNDKVWFLIGTKLVEMPIHSIDIDIDKDGMAIKYWFKIEKPDDFDWRLRSELDLFATKEEFLNQL